MPVHTHTHTQTQSKQNKKPQSVTSLVSDWFWCVLNLLNMLSVTASTYISVCLFWLSSSLNNYSFHFTFNKACVVLFKIIKHFLLFLLTSSIASKSWKDGLFTFSLGLRKHIAHIKKYVSFLGTIGKWIKILGGGLKPPLDPPPPPELKELKLACRVSSGNLN